MPAKDESKPNKTPRSLRHLARHWWVVGSFSSSSCDTKWRQVTDGCTDGGTDRRISTCIQDICIHICIYCMCDGIVPPRLYRCIISACTCRSTQHWMALNILVQLTRGSHIMHNISFAALMRTRRFHLYDRTFWSSWDDSRFIYLQDNFLLRARRAGSVKR